MEKNMHIGSVIKYLRETVGLSQETLSEGICAREYICRLERGKCNPSIDLINLISKKIGMNVYDYYSMIQSHNGLETHKRIINISQIISDNKYILLKQEIDDLSNWDSFSYGIPYQYLKYAEALYISNVTKDYQKAVLVVKEGMKERSEDAELTKVDLQLCELLAVNLCRINKLKDGKVYFDSIYQILENSLKKDNYIDEYTRKYDINILPELLFWKAQIEYDNGQNELAAQMLDLARCMVIYKYNKKEAAALKREIEKAKLERDDWGSRKR